MSTSRTLTGLLPEPAAAASIIGNGRLDALLNEDECRRLLLSIYYPDGPRCPRCKSDTLNPAAVVRFWAGSRFVCQACRQKVNPTAGTLLASKLSAAQIVLIAIGISSEIRNEIIAARVGVVPETVRTWAQKFAALQELRQQ